LEVSAHSCRFYLNHCRFSHSYFRF